MRKKFLSLVMLSLTTLGTTSLFAATVNLYEQPKTDSKIVGNMDSTSSMVPIFTSKDGTWMKIGNPKNGDVGWVKISEFNKNNAGFSFSQQTVSTDQGPKTTIQFGSPQPMTNEQIKAIQKRQLETQKSIQKMVTDMYKTIYGVDPATAGYPAGVVPIYMPVIMVPPTNPKPVTPAK